MQVVGWNYTVLRNYHHSDEYTAAAKHFNNGFSWWKTRLGTCQPSFLVASIENYTDWKSFELRIETLCPVLTSVFHVKLSRASRFLFERCERFFFFLFFFDWKSFKFHSHFNHTLHHGRLHSSLKCSSTVQTHWSSWRAEILAETSMADAFSASLVKAEMKHSRLIKPGSNIGVLIFSSITDMEVLWTNGEYFPFSMWLLTNAKPPVFT